MKKLVLFTVAMVLAFSCVAFADDFLSDNVVPVATGQDAVAVGVSDSVNNNKIASPQDNLNNNKTAFNGGEIAGRDTNPVNVDVDVEHSLNGNRVNSPSLEVKNSLNGNKTAFNGGQIAGRDTNPDNRTYNIVDNAILANINPANGTPVAYTPSNGAMTFTKRQHAEIAGSFHDYNGVSNTNSAAGNMNGQNAYTSISVTTAGNSHR